ncbi:MAG: hypothetical protein JSW58_02545 [Candidatus Latescibacterota bacterium]|nr:MAG: hypothetical protein JSW58_02545 [Candidatus Latescibacterota bacterium]
MKRLIWIAILGLALQACDSDDPFVGDPCSYDSIPGTATIRTISPDTTPFKICDDAVNVYFDFEPDDPNAPDDYRFPAWPDTRRSLFIADGKNPPYGWIEAEGIAEGTQHPCVRLEINKGTCTPVMFRLTEIDYQKWTDYCQNSE